MSRRSIAAGEGGGVCHRGGGEEGGKSGIGFGGERATAVIFCLRTYVDRVVEFLVEDGRRGGHG